MSLATKRMEDLEIVAGERMSDGTLTFKSESVYKSGQVSDSPEIQQQRQSVSPLNLTLVIVVVALVVLHEGKSETDGRWDDQPH